MYWLTSRCRPPSYSSRAWTDTTWSSSAPGLPRESAAYEGRERGASVAIIERDLFGGGCPFWQCMPSKALHAAAVDHGGGEYPWPKASAFRDYMINRVDRDYPDDTSHVRTLPRAGAEPIRWGSALHGR